ncbi:MAG: putative glycoside hydrolase [Patescibacteria group bacterium]
MSTKTEPPKSIKRFFIHAIAVLAGTGGVLAGAYFVLPAMFSVSYVNIPAAVVPLPVVEAQPTAAHLERPMPLKALYMSQCVAGTPSFRNSIVDFVDTSALNAIVIDIRDYTGKIAFPTDNPILTDFVSDACGAKDMKEFVASLHEKGIFVIGRITTFQNPYYAKLHPEEAVQKVGGGVWHDFKGLAFVDAGAKPYWETVVELGKVSYRDMGFDELNFDYLRFPSDGPMKEADYSWSAGKSKAHVLEEFYQYLHDGLQPPGSTPGKDAPILSADLFGYVTVHEDDLGIGQVLERALPYFDYIYPMVYPSHYNKGFASLADINSDPYKVVRASMGPAVARERATTTKIVSFAFTPISSTSPQLYAKPSYPGKVVPWLQAFDYPVHYSPQMIQEQIRATEEVGVMSYLFWDASNKYVSLRQLLAH